MASKTPRNSRWVKCDKRPSNFASITRFPLRPLYTLVEFAFGREFAKQDTFDGWRHLATSLLPVDALDRSFGPERLSVVHTAPPASSSASELSRAWIYTMYGMEYACE